MEDFTEVEKFTIGYEDEVCSDFEVFALEPLIYLKELVASSALGFHIVFTFFYGEASSYWILYEDTSTEPDLLRQNITPVRQASALVTDLQEQVPETIAELMEDLRVRGEAHLKLVDFAVEKARKAVELVPPNHDEVLYLDICIAAMHEHILVERREPIDWIIQHSMDVDEVCMIPTEDSSIESLESKKVLAMNSDSCSICLDEFSENCEATYMPCSHFFHEGCIKKWLKTSHYCPICRFEMPTS